MKLIDVLPWIRSIRPLLILVDLGSVLFAGLLVREHISPFALVAAATAALIVCQGADLHRSRLVLSVLEDLPRLLLAVGVAALVLAAVSPLNTLSSQSTAEIVAVFAIASLALLTTLRAFVYAGVHAMRRNGRTAHPVIIVGAGVVGRRLAESLLGKPELGLVPVGMIDHAPDLSARDLPLPLLGGLRDLDRAMIDLGVNDVIFAFPTPPDARTLSMVRRCAEGNRQVFVVPRFFEMMGIDHHRRVEVIRDVAVMRLRRSGLNPAKMLLKRGLDVTLSAIALVLLAPVMALCALAVRIETGPGVIFKQTRVGIGGRTFTLMKFRSLKPESMLESQTQWSISHDARLGPVGRFLRRSSLDELPQLINVLRGDMSLVGPRPERPHFVQEFSKAQERYSDRHRVQTGLTGHAQVNNLRGDTSIDDRVRYDNYYIENWSLWGDIKIMFRTVAAVVRSEPRNRTIMLTASASRQDADTPEPRPARQ